MKKQSIAVDYILECLNKKDSNIDQISAYLKTKTNIEPIELQKELNVLCSTKRIKKIKNIKPDTYSLIKNLEESNLENKDVKSIKVSNTFNRRNNFDEDITKTIIKDLLKKNSLKKEDLHDLVLSKLNITFNKDEISPDSDYVCFKSKVGNYIADLIKKNEITKSGSKSNGIYSISDNKKVSQQVFQAQEFKPTVDKKLLELLDKNDLTKKTLFNEIIKEFHLSNNELTDNRPDCILTKIKALIGSSISEGVKKDIIISFEKNKEVYYSLSKNKSVEVVSISKEYTKLQSDINSYNDKQKKQILEFICKSQQEYNKNILEIIACDLIAKIYEGKGTLTAGSDDHGIDALIELKDPFGFKSHEIAVQVKCYESKDKFCSPTEVKNFLGSMTSENINYGFIITTGKFDKSEIDKHLNNKDKIVSIGKCLNPNDKLRIICVDGELLVDLLVENELAIIVKDGIIKGIDFNYIDSIIK